MKIRFLHTTPSARPEYPFQAGQVIEVEKQTAEIRGWLKENRAEIVKETPEAAVVGTAGEYAVPSRGVRGR